MPGRIAVVPPRFGPGVVGGSEALSREIAVGLAARGWDVEVLTTTAVDHYSWQDELTAGATWEDGLVVRRFPTVPQWSDAAQRAQLAIQAGRVPPFDEQISWLGWRFTVPELYQHLLRRGDDYDAFLFSPYLFWTTSVCLPLVADRAISMPCLHDETYARLDVVRPALSGAARVWLLSEPEHELAHQIAELPAAHTVTGAGVAIPERYEPERFRARHGLRRPFVLYAGRREPEKGRDWVVDRFREVVRAGSPEVDLVTMGVGDIHVPSDLAGRLIDVGRVSDDERDDAFAAAAAYIQASRMESFSRTIMEAWLAGTPVLATEDSPVVAWHCHRSGGGVTFRDGPSLAAALRQIVDHPDEGRALAARGRQYVVDHYRWPVVLDRMEADLIAMGLEPPGAEPASAPVASPPPTTPDTPDTPDALSDRPAGEAPPSPILVVGSYPPVPAAGTPATERVVRELTARGLEPVVASPRIAAGALHARVAGLLAARRLANLRSVTGARSLVLVVERDLPLPTTGRSSRRRVWRQRTVARTLAREMAEFAHVTVVRVGDLEADVEAWRRLVAGADDVRDDPGDPRPAVGPLGPKEAGVALRARHLASRSAGRLLGPLWPPLRDALIGAARAVKPRATPGSRPGAWR